MKVQAPQVPSPMKSLIYLHPSVYHFAMRKLYGKDFSIRYEALAALVLEGSEVTELCMGDGYLYRNYLSEKNVRYTGLDINRTFVNAALKKNIPAKVHNLLADEIPSADVIILQASLYQFIPHEIEMIQKILNASRKLVLIAEPVDNLAQSSNPLVSFVAKYAVNPGTGHAPARFNEKTLLSCFEKFPQFKEKIRAGKEIIGVFRNS